MTAMKVIGFDSWTGGAINYERIAVAFRRRGIEFKVCHIGSWGGDPSRPLEETVRGVKYKDIRAYGGNHLDRILSAEAPDAVVFLSTDTFAHRAFNRRCRRRGIPTLHLYHGLVSVQEVGPMRAYKVNPMAQLKFVLERIPKALRFIWPAYGSSLVATGATLADWVRFAGDILVMASGRRPHTAAPDARTDRCCVYVEADVSHARRRYGFRRDEVITVGNPDLARFGLDEHNVGMHVDASSDGNEVVYIDTGLVYTGFVFDSPAQFVQHLVATRDALAAAGRKLVFKPHPDHARTTMLDELRAAGIELCFNDDFMSRLGKACASIVEPSSLAIVPALVGMPVFLAQYGPLAGQRYGAVLTSYPRHHALTDIAHFAPLMKAEAEGFDAVATSAWIARNAGPMPASAMPERVLAVVEELVSARFAGAASTSLATPC